AKNSATNIDTNGVVMLKGIRVTQVPTQYMNGAKVIFTPDNIGRAFLGINIVRTIESTDFAGVELQGAGKYGVWVSDLNKKAILTAGMAKGSSASTGK
ncbi:phage capsid protein, partial [Fructobacillus fructosus]